MEKVLQRAKYAERQALKRNSKKKAYLESTEAWQRKQNNQRLARVHYRNLVDARKNRQLDWSLGVLAPRRDVGEKAKKYGAFSIYDFNMPEVVEKKDQLDFVPISEGDRVVIVKGRDQGRIGEVADVQRDRNAVRINGMNVADVEIPEWMSQEGGERRDLQAVPRYMPIENVRLVYPLEDPETGIPRDIIIDRLDCVRKWRDKTFKEEETHKYERFIPGTNTVIPWPETSEQEDIEYDTDTPRMTVEDRTFRPYLLAAPMPISVIDELRNKYSKFRTRHDAEYVEKKEAEAERVEKRKDLGKTMRTPLQELAELRARQKKEAERELSDEQLAKIGEVIEREEKKAMGGVQQILHEQP